MEDNPEGEPGRERLFLLRLLSVANFAINGNMHEIHEREYDKYPPEDVYCTRNIIRALMKTTYEFPDAKGTLASFSTKEYTAKVTELLNMNSSEILRFLFLYSVKSGWDFNYDNLKESPIRFFDSMVGFFEIMKENGCCGKDFWKHLDEIAAEIIGDDHDEKPISPASPIKITLEEIKFILAVMKYIYSLNSREAEFPTQFGNIAGVDVNFLPDIDERILTALRLAHNDLDRKIRTLLDFEAVFRHHRKQVFTKFSDQAYLDFCVSYTNALFRGNERPSADYVFRLLKRGYEFLKRNGRVDSVESLIKGANEITEFLK